MPTGTHVPRRSARTSDVRYQEYCLADPQFYDSPRHWAVEETSFPEARRETPDGWIRRDTDPWLLLAPRDVELPAQGWKIHASTSLDDAEAILKTTYEYCVASRVAFKFLPTGSLVVARNLRYAGPGASGRFITIYPPDEAALLRILTELGDLLRGRRGPYILGDLRWESGPLHVRYGAFVERYRRDTQGEPTPAIADPSGALLPESRQPEFAPPDWVALPACLQPQWAGGGDMPTPYVIEHALHVCNGGGSYVARDPRYDRLVVLREARPHAGLEPNGRDAVARLERERDILASLADVEQVVNGFDHFVLREHHFLVREFVEGQTLTEAVLERHPLVRAECPDDRIVGYTGWALGVLDRIEAGVAELHARGVTYGDLNPDNVIVRPGGEIAFIDFELSYRDGEGVGGGGVGAPGYVPPDGRIGPAVDRYALACLRLSVFLPFTALFTLDTGKAEMLARAVQERFPVPPGYGDRVLRALDLKPVAHTGTAAQRATVAGLVAALDSADPDWTGFSASLAAATLASATPERTDRLFPGDIQQFVTNGLGLAHGAAGVLYALSVTGHGRHRRHEEWLLRGVRAGRSERQVGFYDGLHGIAYALDHLGRHDEAADVLERAMAVPPEELPSDLFGGLAGIGLNLLHFAGRADDLALHDAALETGEVLAGRFDTLPAIPDGCPPVAATGRLGLMRGATGYALFFLRLFERTGDPRWLDRTERALRYDLRCCVRATDDATIRLDEGWRVLPYVASGSAGIGLVLRDYLRHRPDEDLTARLAGIERAARAEFVAGSGLFAGPGLFNGRAGLLALLARGRVAGAPDPVREAAIEGHRRRLAWHAVGYRGHVAYPGEQLLRLSTDLGTGNAGILLALAAARGDAAMLPFLGPDTRSPAGPAPPAGT